MWDEINQKLDGCEDWLHHLHWIITSHIERSIEENECSKHDEEILIEVYNYLNK